MKAEASFKESGVSTAILALLQERPCHGYEIAREVERRSGNRLEMAHSTLYPQLYRLEKSGLIESYWEQPAGEKRRRVYRLTESGARAAREHIQQWQRLARALNRVIATCHSAA